MQDTQRPLGATTLVRYAAGSLGTGGFSTLPGLVLIYYLTDTLGVVPLVAGLILAVAKAWDVVIDPLVGMYSDRQLARRGSRRGFMRTGALALPVLFVVTFATPASLSPGWAALWVGLAFLAASTAFSLFQVPYIALPAELSPSYHQRTRLLTWRVVVLSFAILLFGAGGSSLRSLGGGNAWLGYLIMAVVAGAVICAGLLYSSGVAARSEAARPPAAARRRSVSKLGSHYAAGLRSLRQSRPFRLLLAAYLLQGMATGDMLAGANYVATWVLGNPDAVPLLFTALIAPALLVTPLWGVLARRIGKERSFLYASILFGAGSAAMGLLACWPGAWVYAAVALCGAAYAGMQSLPMAMLPDVISDDAKRHGPGRAGVFGGLWTAGETCGLALGAGLFSVVLAVSGYQAHAGAATVEQSARAVLGIALSFSLVPAALIMLSLVPIAGYRLRRGDIDG